MLELNYDLVIIGGGPAGLSAALEAKEQGINNLIILERNDELGGILNQCIHDGFGLLTFKKQLSGPEYVQYFIDKIIEEKIEYKLNTMVTDITKEKIITAMNSKDGIMKIKAKAIILAMGCRERTKSQVFIMGTRPSGVFTAGTVQNYINIKGYIPGKKAVILGSGDIGLIMARRMKLEGIDVVGVYEVKKEPGGLNRNIYQCLIDYNIPLHLSTTVVQIHGNDRVEGVTVQKVDENGKLIENTKEYIECDLLVLSVGLIPENELTKKAGSELSNITKGPLIDSNMMTTQEGIFACGNVVNVFDLVDYVSQTSKKAAIGVKKYLDNNIDNDFIQIEQGENANFLIPQKISKNDPIDIYFRVKKVLKSPVVEIKNENNELIFARKYQILRPQEMTNVKCISDKIKQSQKIVLSIKEG